MTDDDPDLIRFGSRGGGEHAHAPETCRPPRAALCGFGGCVQLLDEDGPFRSSPPVAGEALPLDVEFPFEGRIGDPLWYLHMPRAAGRNR